MPSRSMSLKSPTMQPATAEVEGLSGRVSRKGFLGPPISRSVNSVGASSPA